VTKLLETLTEAARQKTEQATTRYWELVGKAVRNEDYDPGEVLDVCEAADFSLMEFNEAVEAEIARLEKLMKARQLEALQVKQATIEKEINAKNDAFARIASEHSKQVQALARDMEAITPRIHDAMQARNWLLNNPSPPLAAKIKALGMNRSQLSQRLKEIQAGLQGTQAGTLATGKSGLERQVEDAKALAAKIRTPKSASEIATTEKNLARFMTEKWEPAQAEAERIRQSLAAIESKLSAINSQILGS